MFYSLVESQHDAVVAWTFKVRLFITQATWLISCLIVRFWDCFRWTLENRTRRRDIYFELALTVSGVKVNTDLIGQIEVLSKLIVNTNFTEPIYNAFTEILSGRISLTKIENLVSVYQLGLESEVRPRIELKWFVDCVLTVSFRRIACPQS